jgi:hypothetical protein
MGMVDQGTADAPSSLENALVTDAAWASIRTGVAVECDIGGDPHQ